MPNNHVQNNINNTLQDETSSQLCQTDQHDTQANAIVNTNGNNRHVNNGTQPMRLNDNRNVNGQGNRNNGNNVNDGHKGKKRNSKDPTFDDHGSNDDYPYEDGRGGSEGI
ncbi:hypothetical protein L195_g015205 [Trifolium pratense]|uniref:Uncharacterized protein n=1 Tax=Trifolium pratense TaxID=57577 RepID=A0A2K3MMP3_TRIPR|nr:hypothetical protein L195_g015205 [Trifolium pratense]